MATADIDLADFIQQLRSELETALATRQEAKGTTLFFKPKNIDLELKVAAERKGVGGGKLSFKIFGIGAEAEARGELSRADTHTIKLSLDLVDRDGKTTILIGDEIDPDKVL